MRNTEAEKDRPSRGYKHICLPFKTEAQYRACVNDPKRYRQFLKQMLEQYPEIFPQAISEGYKFHDRYRSSKQQLVMRRIKLKSTREVLTLRPSFVMPYQVGRTDQIEKALYLRKWGVPFEALAEVFGHNAMFWYRAWLSLGRPNLVGTTVKHAEQLPPDLVADEKISWLDGQEVYLPVTVGGGCVLGISLVEKADAPELKQGYGEFAAEAAEVFPAYQPRSVCTDGFKSTRLAWRQLFPRITQVLCFLHSILKIKERCRGALRKDVLDRAWNVYEATTKREFAQRARRLSEWAQRQVSGALLEMVEKLCRRRIDFTPAYDCTQAARTTNQVDRLMDHLDRVLYSMRYCHGHKASARLAVRAWAIQWNFHPYGRRLRHEQPSRSSPFDDLNGFHYHDNWLHNFLIAASMGGKRL